MLIRGLDIIGVIDKEAYYCTYCIVMRAPKDSFKDILIYGGGDPYLRLCEKANTLTRSMGYKWGPQGRTRILRGVLQQPRYVDQSSFPVRGGYGI